MKRILLFNLALITALTFGTVAPGQAATDADNSAKNTIDRSGETVTSVDQSNAKADVEITAAIRRAVVKDSSLSGNAHNVKIITTEKHVIYLRGPVDSADEITAIVKLAKQNAAGYPVKNQLSITKK